MSWWRPGAARAPAASTGGALPEFLRERALKVAPRSASDAPWFWGDGWNSVPSVTGLQISPQSALNVTAVLACVTMLAEDVAKLPPALFRRKPDGSREEVKDHFLSALFRRPNDWQDWLEFCEMMQVGLILRGNAYAVIIRDGRATPIKLVPINPDRVALWEAPSGDLFYRVTPFGFHEMAELEGQPYLISAADMLHVRGFSTGGLLGASRIVLAREAIALALGQEQQAARWMGQGARPSGMMTTDQKLTPEGAKRVSEDIKNNWAGLQNSGKIIIGEQGMKFIPFSMTSADLEFIASRKFQMEDVGRIFRVPPHMYGDLSRSTHNNIAQQSQEYANYTLSGYTVRWERKLEWTFGLDDEDLFVEFDMDVLLKADIVSRYNVYRMGIMSMVMKPNEARLKEGFKPDPHGDKLIQPSNVAFAGSQSAGTSEGGRPPEGTLPA